MISSLKSKIINNKLFQDSFWAIFGNVLAKGMGLFSGIFVARYLGSEVFGQFGIIKSTLLTCSIFASFGLGYSATKYISENYNSKSINLIPTIRNFQYLSVFLGIIGFLIVFIFSEKISLYAMGTLKFGDYLKFYGVFILFNTINITQVGIISGLAKFKELTRVGLFIGISSFFSTIFFSYYFQLHGAVFSYVLVQILNLIFNNRIINSEKMEYSTKLLNGKESDLLVSKKEILKFSIPIAIQECVYSISAWALTVILLKYSSFQDVGVYSAAIQWNIIVLFIPSVLRNVILSHFSSTSNDPKKKKYILFQVLLFNLIVTFLPYLIVLIFSDLITSLYGESFEILSSILPLILLSAIFVSLSNVYSQAFMSEARNWEMLIVRIIRDSGIPLTLFFLLHYKITNYPPLTLVAYSMIFFYFLSLLIMFVLFNVKWNKV